MKVWVMAGLITAGAVPFAGAAEASAECQVDDSRRLPHVRIDGGGPGGSAATTATPTVAPRESSAERQAQRDTTEVARAAAAAERRRNGKRIPDAELIGPRGAL